MKILNTIALTLIMFLGLTVTNMDKAEARKISNGAKGMYAICEIKKDARDRVSLARYYVRTESNVCHAKSSLLGNVRLRCLHQAVKQGMPRNLLNKIKVIYTKGGYKNSCTARHSICRYGKKSDSDGDGYGFEKGKSCVVETKRSYKTYTLKKFVKLDTLSNSSKHPTCKKGKKSDSDGDGYGWENGKTCIVK